MPIKQANPFVVNQSPVFQNVFDRSIQAQLNSNQAQAANARNRANLQLQQENAFLKERNLVIDRDIAREKELRRRFEAGEQMGENVLRDRRNFSEGVRRADRTFDEGVRRDNRNFSQRQGQFDRSMGMEEKRFQLSKDKFQASQNPPPNPFDSFSTGGGYEIGGDLGLPEMDSDFSELDGSESDISLLPPLNRNEDEFDLQAQLDFLKKAKGSQVTPNVINKMAEIERKLSGFNKPEQKSSISPFDFYSEEEIRKGISHNKTKPDFIKAGLSEAEEFGLSAKEKASYRKNLANAYDSMTKKPKEDTPSGEGGGDSVKKKAGDFLK